MSQEEIFTGSTIAIAKWPDGFIHLRIAGRPTVGTKVPDIKILFGANGPGRIAQIALAYVGVALALNKNGVAFGLFFAGEQRKNTLACHFWQSFEAGSFEECGRKVGEIDE